MLLSQVVGSSRLLGCFLNLDNLPLVLCIIDATVSATLCKSLEAIFAIYHQGVNSVRSLFALSSRGSNRNAELLPQRVDQAMDSGLTNAVVPMDIARPTIPFGILVC